MIRAALALMLMLTAPVRLAAQDGPHGPTQEARPATERPRGPEGRRLPPDAVT